MQLLVETLALGKALKLQGDPDLTYIPNTIFYMLGLFLFH